MDTTVVTGVIYVNQRGAGCGKTFESIQLIQSDVRFAHKTEFIYLTKMHSAKEVIVAEFTEQQDRGLLTDLHCTSVVDATNQHSKQYKLTFTNTVTAINIAITIGTIDSFNYAIVNRAVLEEAQRKRTSGDYFGDILESITSGNIHTDSFKYAGTSRLLNNKCLIIIDEANDLPTSYIKAFATIVAYTNIDMYIIGDKLQSIWGDDNILTYLDCHDSLSVTLPAISTASSVAVAAAESYISELFCDYEYDPCEYFIETGYDDYIANTITGTDDSDEYTTNIHALPSTIVDHSCSTLQPTATSVPTAVPSPQILQQSAQLYSDMDDIIINGDVIDTTGYSSCSTSIAADSSSSKGAWESEVTLVSMAGQSHPIPPIPPVMGGHKGAKSPPSSSNIVVDIAIIKSTGVNRVMRFHNLQFMSFVNSVIPFNKYDLPQIADICAADACPYKHENAQCPYTLFEMPNLYRIRSASTNIQQHQKHTKEQEPTLIGDTIAPTLPARHPMMGNYDGVHSIPAYNALKYILQRIDAEVAAHNYLPHNFMFIFPILKNNEFAEMLQSHLSAYWTTKFNCPIYQRAALLHHPYWGTRICDKMYYNYAVLHHSEEGYAINLRESVYATRILSIHAAKGQGCEVVFALGLTERALKRFSGAVGNLMYDSLLHVALTRQKKALYIGVERNNDEICQRFAPFTIQPVEGVTPSSLHISCCTKINNITSYILQHSGVFDSINTHILKPHNLSSYSLLLINQQGERSHPQQQLMDWGHHKIRYSAMYNTLLFYISQSNATNCNNGDQCNTILRKLHSKSIRRYDNITEYYTAVKQLRDSSSSSDSIPILSLSADSTTPNYQYCSILIAIIKRVQLKLRRADSYKVNWERLPLFCAVESIVFLYIIQLISNGRYSSITPTEIYSILNSFDSCAAEYTIEHSEKYECVCHSAFTGKYSTQLRLDIVGHSHGQSRTARIAAYKGNDTVRTSIRKHYKCVDKVRDLYKAYVAHITTILQNAHCSAEGMKLTYNINHTIWHNSSRGAWGSEVTPSSTVDVGGKLQMINQFAIIAHNASHVFNIVLKPQFNKLNYYEMLLDIVFSTSYLLQKCTGRNAERFSKKTLVICIFTLDSDAPMFFTLNLTLEQWTLCNNITEQYLMYNYVGAHANIIAWFKQYYRDFNANTSAAITALISKTRETNSKIPRYITNALQNMQHSFSSGDSSDDVDATADEIANELLTNLRLAIAELI
jgi:hypothetical protein